MINVYVRNVSEAWALFVRNTALSKELRIVAPRGVKTLEFTSPVATTYTRPDECVLFDPVRDCNPFFHLYEALWILCGFNDVKRVAYYSKQIELYSDNQETFHGAYGYRMRKHFSIDQIDEVVEVLTRDPWSRRAVISLWDPDADLPMDAAAGKDLPCNTVIFFKIREGRLNMTVCNRSNDAVWGCYGANAVQFSFLLQYIAARLRVAVGVYTQISDSLHVYLEGKAGEVWERCKAKPPSLLQSYEPPGDAYAMRLIDDPEGFIGEARTMLANGDGTPHVADYAEPFLHYIALPMFWVHDGYRKDGAVRALNIMTMVRRAFPRYANNAWLVAGTEWLNRRIKLGERNESQRPV